MLWFPHFWSHYAATFYTGPEAESAQLLLGDMQRNARFAEVPIEWE